MMIVGGGTLARRKFVLQHLIELGKCLPVRGSNSSRISEESFRKLFDLINQNDDIDSLEEKRVIVSVDEDKNEIEHLDELNENKDSLILLDLSWMSSLVSFVVCPSELYGKSNSKYSNLLNFFRSCFFNRSDLIKLRA